MPLNPKHPSIHPYYSPIDKGGVDAWLSSVNLTISYNSAVQLEYRYCERENFLAVGHVGVECTMYIYRDVNEIMGCKTETTPRPSHTLLRPSLSVVIRSYMPVIIYHKPRTFYDVPIVTEQKLTV